MTEKATPYSGKDENDEACPFCGESGFDLPGLKSHLEHDCAIYEQTERLERKFC